MKKIFLYTGVFSILMCACGPENETVSTTTANADSTATETKPQQITLTPFSESPEYTNAMLELNTPGDGDILNVGSVNFDFNVKNYELGAQTPDAENKMCANSDKGQHIHLILNNEPYSAHYEAAISKDMEPGNYAMLAFISRSYHESIKTPDAYVLRNFTVGDVTPENKVDIAVPHLFYSRPKGTYNGKDTKKVMLDFYLVNTELSPNGSKVRATINGQEFIIETWKPHFIEGMPMGENTIKLELLDAQGNVVESPFNPVERTIELTDLQ